MGRRTLALLGPDVLLVAMGGRRPNNAILVVECEGRLDAARVSEAVRRATDVVPWIAARLERPVPWGRLRWRLDLPLAPDLRPIVHVSTGDDRQAVDRCLNTAIDARREPPLRIEVVSGEREGRPATWLVLCWTHPLMDPRGAELLVAMLDALAGGDDGRRWVAERLIEPPDDPRGWRERATIARRGVAHLKELGFVRRRSPGTGVARPGRVRHRRVVLPDAGARQLPATLGLVGAAVSTLWRERGEEPGDEFLVPVSVDRRRKGEPGPVIGNFLSFHFARFPSAGTAGEMAQAIRRDMAEAVRADVVEATWVGMNFARYYPPAMLLRPVGGEDLASFNCADTGEVRPARPSLFGATVRGAYHVPCVQPFPGLGVFFSRAAGQESVTAVWHDGVVGEDEIDALLGRVTGALRGADAA